MRKGKRRFAERLDECSPVLLSIYLLQPMEGFVSGIKFLVIPLLALPVPGAWVPDQVAFLTFATSVVFLVYIFLLAEWSFKTFKG